MSCGIYFILLSDGSLFQATDLEVSYTLPNSELKT